MYVCIVGVNDSIFSDNEQQKVYIYIYIYIYICPLCLEQNYASLKPVKSPS